MLFEKLDGFNIDYPKEQTLFKNVAIFDFELICVPSEELKPTETITWIVKHEPISVSSLSNLLDKPIFLSDKDPQSLIIDFVANLELLAKKIKTEMRSNFWKLKTTSKSDYTQFLAYLMNEIVSTRLKQESTKTNVSRMREKQTHPLTFPGFKKIND